MQAILLQFEESMRRARDIAALQSALGAQTAPALDLSDLLRASIVLFVSALDSLVHELVRHGMVEIHAGRRVRTKAFDSFEITLADLQSATSGRPGWLADAIRKTHKWRTFQQPDKIAEAISLISPASLWEDVAKSMKRPARDVRTQLQSIVDRRNKIAHEADLDPSYPGTRWPIAQKDVAEAATFMEEVGRAITAAL